MYLYHWYSSLGSLKGSWRKKHSEIKVINVQNKIVFTFSNVSIPKKNVIYV